MNTFQYTQLPIKLNDSVFDLLLDCVLDELEIEDSDGTLTYFDIDKEHLRMISGVFTIEDIYEPFLLVVSEPGGSRIILELSLGSFHHFDFIVEHIELLNHACSSLDFRKVRSDSVKKVLSEGKTDGSRGERITRLLLETLSSESGFARKQVVGQ